VEATCTNRRRGLDRRVWLLALEIVLTGLRLILYDFDVRGGNPWCPLPLGRCSQMLELSLLPTSPEGAAS